MSWEKGHKLDGVLDQMASAIMKVAKEENVYEGRFGFVLVITNLNTFDVAANIKEEALPHILNKVVTTILEDRVINTTENTSSKH